MSQNNKVSSTIRYVDTITAYEKWSTVYDTDGNFLQALDTVEMKTLLPQLLAHIQTEKPWRVVDLGCGTGRNTVALLSVPHTEIVGLDLSPKMLEVARQRLETESQNLNRDTSPRLEVFDMITDKDVPECAQQADALVSTLVVEHVPLDVYFDVAAKVLKPGGMMLVTNMHHDMGMISQAGFVDPATGVKIRPTSYAHTIADLVVVAGKHGFEVVQEFDERQVDRTLIAQLGPRAEKWIGVTVWFGGLLRKRLY